jgi:hypothetical protein
MVLRIDEIIICGHPLFLQRRDVLASVPAPIVGYEVGIKLTNGLQPSLKKVLHLSLGIDRLTLSASLFGIIRVQELVLVKRSATIDLEPLAHGHM